MYTNEVFGMVKGVQFIEVSLFKGVLIRGFHCTHTRGMTSLGMTS